MRSEKREMTNLDLWLIGTLAAYLVWRIHRERRADKREIERQRLRANMFMRQGECGR